MALLAVGVFWFFVSRDDSESDPNNTARCTKAPSNTVKIVDSGLRNEVTSDPETAILVEINESDRDSANWPQALYAVQVTPPEGAPQIAIWGIGNPRGLVVPVTSLNQAALDNSTWGAREGDMNAEANRKFASALMEQRLIDQCVNAKVNAE